MQLEPLTQHSMLEGPAQYPATAVPEHCEVARHFPFPLGVEHGGAVQHLMSLDPVPFRNQTKQKIRHHLTSRKHKLFTWAESGSDGSAIAAATTDAHTNAAVATSAAGRRVAADAQGGVTSHLYLLCLTYRKAHN
jgi:hypothetical protein